MESPVQLVNQTTLLISLLPCKPASQDLFFFFYSLAQMKYVHYVYLHLHSNVDDTLLLVSGRTFSYDVLISNTASDDGLSPTLVLDLPNGVVFERTVRIIAVISCRLIMHLPYLNIYIIVSFMSFTQHKDSEYVISSADYSFLQHPKNSI